MSFAVDLEKLLYFLVRTYCNGGENPIKWSRQGDRHPAKRRRAGAPPDTIEGGMNCERDICARVVF